MGVVTERELTELVGRVRAARVRLRARQTTPASKDFPVRIRSLYRTHDRLGVRDYSAGDSIRLLVLRDLLNRNVLNVRTYYALSEVVVHVVLDPSLALLGDTRTGPFAVKLAFGLAGAGLGARQSALVTFLGRRGRIGPFNRPRDIGPLIRALAAIEPVATRADQVPVYVHADLHRPRANTNLFLLTHVGHRPAAWESLLRTVSSRVRAATVFPIVSAADFEDSDRPIRNPDDTTSVDAPADRVQRLIEHVDQLMHTGTKGGVRVEPLLVHEPAEDLEALLPWLAGLT
jgi:hypothetical protein